MRAIIDEETNDLDVERRSRQGVVGVFLVSTIGEVLALRISWSRYLISFFLTHGVVGMNRWW